MPKYLKAFAMTTEKPTAEQTYMWLILPKYINCHYFVLQNPIPSVKHFYGRLLH